MKKDSGFFTFMGILLLVAIAVFVGARMLLLKNDVPQGVIVNSPYQAKIVTNKFGKAVIFSPDSVRFLGFYSGKVWGEIGHWKRGIIEFNKDSNLVYYSRPVEDLQEYVLPVEPGMYYTSQKAIKKKAIGMTLDEVEKKWRMATYVSRNDSGEAKAYFDMIGALKSDGCFYNIMMLFDKEGKCREVVTGMKAKDSNSWLLSKMPYAETIAGQDWLMMNVQDSIYDRNHGQAWYLKLLVFCATMYLLIIWALAPLILPTYLCIQFAATFSIFNKVPNWAMAACCFVLTAISAYVWSIPLLAWGVYWWLLIPVFIYFICIQTVNNYKDIEHGSNGIPSRCPHCHKMFGLKEVKRELIKQYKLSEAHTDHSSEEHEEFDRYEKRRLEVTISTNYNSETSVHIENIPFYKVTEVHKYHHYTLKYRVEEYDVTYQCSDCGYNTHRVDTKKNLLERIEGDTTTKEVPLHEKYVIPKNTSEDKIHTTYRLLNT